MTKRTMLAALTLVSALASTPALAAGHDGVWKSNAAKSWWTNGPMPDNFSLTIKLTWTTDTLEYHSVNDSVKTRPMSNDFTATLDDKVGPLPGNARFNEIRIRRLGPDIYQVLEQKDGDVIVGQRWEFSKDGRSLVRWGVGKAPDGKSKAFSEWFDKVG